jgi:hypothetical protein
VLVRLLWSALHPELGLVMMPKGWFCGPPGEVVTVPHSQTLPADPGRLTANLAALFGGQIDGFAGWVRERAANQNHPFEIAVREADLESLGEFAKQLEERRVSPVPNRSPETGQ